MSRHIKTGYLRHYHKGLLSKKWKDYFFVLYDDSTLQWYEKQNDQNPEGIIRIRDIAQYLCVGPYTRCLLHRPSLPRPTDEANLIALPRSSTGHHHQEIVWILCNDVTHLNDWMKAIVSTLPPPPPPPPQQQGAAVRPSAPPSYPTPVHGGHHQSGGGSSLASAGVGFAGGAIIGGALGYAWGGGFGGHGGWGYGMGPAGYGGWSGENDTTIINNYSSTDNDNSTFNDCDDGQQPKPENNYTYETNDNHKTGNTDEGYGNYGGGGGSDDYNSGGGADYSGGGDYGSGGGDFGGGDCGGGD